MSETVFARPMFAVADKCVADTGGGPRSILGMNLFLPEADIVGGDRRRVTEERFEALGPGKGAGGYRPNPNSIIRSLGSERKMLRDFILAARRVCRNFMGSMAHFLGDSVLVLMGVLALN